jgi:hypothetical protein
MKLSRRISRLEQRLTPERRSRFLVIHEDSGSPPMSQADMNPYTRIWVVKTIRSSFAEQPGDKQPMLG